jgi:antitoxin PrlF
MEEATLTSKGQLTLPKAMRETLGVRAGDRIRFVPARNGYRLVVVKKDLRSLAGFLKGRRETPLTIAGMNRAIARMGIDQEPDD